ncbi:hypothetical protein Pan258_20390 [Symmachiella dynata]|uniref:cytochrome c n=1 Tax=Symmachiella dynata TaxID=2527995 RepID=UPI00118D35DA|nr:cytochrome c [Symmachiella dynata]QDT47999.1 hypothetical protein Pan258_20390 [Symmachiella dynata]
MKKYDQQSVVERALNVVVLVVFGTFCGCSGSEPTTETPSNDPTGAANTQSTLSNATPSETTPSNATAQAAPPADDPAKVPTTISGIPLDVWPNVWFEDPLAVANSGATVGTTASTGTPKGATTSALSTNPAATNSSPEPANSKGSSDQAAVWAALLSGEGIQLEAKTIRLALRQAFQSVQRYNGNYKDLQVQSSVMALLGMIAETHPDSITWKAHGPEVRDLSAKLAATATGLGRQHYDPASRLYEQLEQLLSGNQPADLEPPNPNAQLDEFAPRNNLMKRMQLGDAWLQANTGDENSFRSQPEQLRHELSMLALLATVTARKEYDMADEPEYVTQSQALIQAAQDALQAAEQTDFAAYSAARERMTKACTACHLDFRFDAE